MNPDRRARLRAAIERWHDARWKKGDCVATSEGQYCCVDSVGDDETNERAARYAGLDALLDVIEHEIDQ